MRFRLVCIVLGFFALATSASAQQRPLITEDPETVGAGRILVEGGVEWSHDAHYPVSGLSGDLLRLPTIGVSFGISSIAEFQVDGGLHDRLTIKARNAAAPLAGLVTATGGTTTDIEDVVVPVNASPERVEIRPFNSPTSSACVVIARGNDNPYKNTSF